jgi:hypothetical protein
VDFSQNDHVAHDVCYRSATHKNRHKQPPTCCFLSIFTGTLILCIISYAEIGTTEVYVSDEGYTKEVTKIGEGNTINTNALAIIAGNGILATLYLIHAYPKLKWAFLYLLPFSL